MKKLIIVLLFAVIALNKQVYAEARVGDSTYAVQIITPPVIDGVPTDNCWDSAAWNYITYNWIPYNVPVDSADFYGQYKVLWNQSTGLLYFLFEITDDKFVKGYTFAIGDNSYPNYDCLELFIDENKSGGNHMFDNNAYAYHITGGNDNTYFDVADLGAGTWETNKVNYKSHFPEFKRELYQGKYIWEFSVVVLNDQFVAGDNINNFKVPLVANKDMGFCVAYCDNDNSNVSPARDNFIGSVFLTEEDQNSAWMDASLFGNLRLLPAPVTLSGVNTNLAGSSMFSVYPNPVNTILHIKSQSADHLVAKICTINGQVICTKLLNTTIKNETEIDFSSYSNGIYYLEISNQNTVQTFKIVK